MNRQYKEYSYTLLEINQVHKIENTREISNDKSVGSIPACYTNCKGNVVPVLFLTEHHTMKAYWWSGGIDPRIICLRH